VWSFFGPAIQAVTGKGRDGGREKGKRQGLAGHGCVFTSFLKKTPRRFFVRQCGGGARMKARKGL